jgi:hypothetical protein
MSDLLRDLLLESPIPSSIWMPTRSQQLADAGLTLRRRFGQARVSRRAHRIRDIAPSHLPGMGVRSISGETIEAELEEDITAINPPTIQGWAWLLLVPVGLVMLLGLGRIAAFDWATGLLLLAAGPAAWALLVFVWGVAQHEVALNESGIALRRWSDQRLGRPGVALGYPGEVRAIVAERDVTLRGPRGASVLHLWLWPPSAIADLHDKLPAWGVDSDDFSDPDHHHRHQRHHHRRRRDGASAPSVAR